MKDNDMGLWKFIKKKDIVKSMQVKIKELERENKELRKIIKANSIYSVR